MIIRITNHGVYYDGKKAVIPIQQLFGDKRGLWDLQIIRNLYEADYVIKREIGSWMTIYKLPNREFVCHISYYEFSDYFFKMQYGTTEYINLIVTPLRMHQHAVEKILCWLRWLRLPC